jgi:hypothetical protein
MTHLTATDAATAHRQVVALDRSGRKHRRRTRPLCATAAPAKSVFDSRVANFLEMRTAAFHYSVIGGYAKISLAPGLADSHLLIDEVAASDLWADGAGALARAGGE